VADEDVLEVREQVRPLLGDAADTAQTELIFSLVDADDELAWLRGRLADALRD
jgi:hypothetical protein